MAESIPHVNFIDGCDDDADRSLAADMACLRSGVPAPDSANEDNSQASLIHHFMLQLSCNHTVVPETLKNDDGSTETVLSASSPDEV